MAVDRRDHADGSVSPCFFGPLAKTPQQGNNLGNAQLTWRDDLPCPLLAPEGPRPTQRLRAGGSPRLQFSPPAPPQ